MKIKQIIVGRLEENCYILEKDGQILVIDPGDDTDRIINGIKGKKVLKILITHEHFDHVGSVYDIMDIYKIGQLNFSHLEEKEYEIGPFKFKVIFNPGHSEDSISYYFEKEQVMFVGDFVFNGTIGRCDLDGGDYNQMKESIKKLKTYPKDTVLYPGHGNKTTLENELRHNPYF